MKRVAPGQRVRVSCNVNEKLYSGFAESRTLLSDFLRHELHLYGTHVGCEHGVCGACTIILDGRLARSCSTLAVQVEGADLTTIEGLATDESLDRLRDAFSGHGALQCGFCTPGVLASTSHFLKHYPNPDEAQVRDMLSGHLCRCTGYDGMVRAILEFAKGASG
jgi:2-furoyl-CoA dehydrogenase 2Fe-2S iron sulfur subunit